MAMTAQQVTSALIQARARWQAKTTPQSLLSDANRRRLLGAVPSPAALAQIAAPSLATPPTFAPAVDWRNHNGNNITSIKDQGGCGSCVSFASCALTEAIGIVERSVTLDLSEADAHFCSNHGTNCGGWWPDQCLDQIIGRGVCTEADFPYASAFPNNDMWSEPPQCHQVADRDKHAVKITRRVSLNDATAVKNYLTTTGPVVGCFTVYDDFFNYSTGVYHHVTGAVAGGHCVLVIGYSEANQAWLCKNSWGAAWGNSGFFEIAYADLLYDGRFFAMYGAQGVVLPSEVGGFAVVYEHANYGGRYQVLAPGRYDVNQLAIGNDVVSSVKVPPGQQVILYMHGNFQAPTLVLTADTPALPSDFNDQTSGISVETTGSVGI